MEKTIIDSFNNTIKFFYDESTDSITVTNSALDNTVMNVVRNTSSDCEGLDVFMIAEYVNYNDWSDTSTKDQLRTFWDENKKNKMI